MNKRGLTVKTIVTILLLLVGFAIILFLYYQISWTGRVNKEVCHESVIFRATLPVFGGAQEYVPLKCKTDRECITTGFIGGKCEEDFGKTTGITKVKVSSANDVNKAVAESIVDCWSMMGEGKVSLFSQWLAQQYGFGDVYPTCVICSRIAFDKEKLEKAGIDLTKIDVMDYMQRYKISGKDETYYDYLTGGGLAKLSVGDLVGSLSDEEKKSSDSLLEEKNVEKIGEKDVSLENSVDYGSATSDAEINKLNQEYAQTTNKEFADDEIAVLFMQISAPTHGGVFKNSLTAVLSVLGLSFAYKPGAFVTNLARAPAGGITIGSKFYKGGQFLPKSLSTLRVTLFAKIIAATAIAVGIAQQGNVAYNRAVTAGYCGDVSVGGASGDGCSVVRTINYNVEDINQYCSIIESIP